MSDMSSAMMVFPGLDLLANAGVWRMGPIKRQAAERIIEIFSDLDLTTGADERIQIIECEEDQVSLLVTGEEVTGYLAESDGFEAASETLEALVLRCCQLGMPVVMSGHYSPDEQARIDTRISAIHDGTTVFTNITRGNSRPSI